MGEDITLRFDPIEVTPQGIGLMEVCRENFKLLALDVEDFTVPGRAQSIAFTELESAHRAVNRAIAEANRKES